MNRKYHKLFAFVYTYFLFSCAVGFAEEQASFVSVANEISLFDFEDGVSNWTNQDLPKYNEPTVTVESSNEYATSGSKSLKLTYAGGYLPAVFNQSIPVDDWSSFNTLLADVYLERDALVVFRILQEKSTRDNGWGGYMGRFERAALLKKGHHTMVTLLRSKRDHKFSNSNGKIIRFEIALYDAVKGESLYIDNVRLSATLPEKNDWPISQYLEYMPTKGLEFQVLGTDMKVKGFADLANRFKEQWKEPTPKTIAEVENEYKKKLKEYQKENPQARLVIVRNGTAGFNASRPEEVYEGWGDAYLTSHEPESMLMQTGIKNYGNVAQYEIFMRHRVALMRADLSFLSPNSKILEAGLLISRTSLEEPSRCHRNPNMWVMELCNRPWVESEVNTFQYARYGYWNNYNGRQWDGRNPDSLPIIAGYGPGQGENNQWDFTHAVKRWVEEKEPNHGFWLYGDSKDWLLRAHYSESSDLKKRPALAIIYLP